MAKYSTGESTSVDNSCQLCGTTEGQLTTAKVEGAVITVCRDCEPDEAHREDHKSETESPTKKTTPTKDKKKNTKTKQEEPEKVGYTISKTDAKWVENTNYGNTDTPYMQKHYATKIEHALDEQDLTLERIAEETNAPLEDLEALANGNALDAGVGKNVIESLERALDIELIESV